MTTAFRFIFLLALVGAGPGLPPSFAAPTASPARPAGEPGTIVSTPPDMTYYALKGDTLSTIALRFTEKLSNWSIIGKRNRITNDRTIPVGSAILVPLELLPEEMSKATVVALAGQSAAKNADGSEFTLQVGSTLTEGSQVTTSKNGFLSLALPDNSRISIPSNSQVKLSKLRMAKYTKSPRTEVTLLQGRVESTVTPLEASKGRFEVRSPLAIAGVRGTHFRVGINDNGIANEVLTGKVATGKPEKPDAVLVPAGQGNIVSSQSVGKPLALLPPPELSGNYQLQEKPTIQIEVQKLERAAAYRAQIASDPEAQNLLAEGRVSGTGTDTRFKFDGLPDGSYFVRATAIDALGLEGIPTILPFTLKARPEPPFSVQPKAKLRADKVEFSWTEAADAKSYRLQVANDAAFSNIVLDQAGINDIRMTAETLKPGTYFWRAATVTEKNGRPDQGPFSDVQSFVLMPPQPAMAPFTDNGDKELSFNWPSEPGQKFLLQIGRDPTFTSLYLSKELEQPELRIPRPDAGQYFIRVRATDADGYTGAFSSTQKITIYSRWVTGNGEAVISNGGAVKSGQ
ncbi:FecR domain-containing protein [Undibacterium sp. TJN25]|uniref:FecR domain-containing protein n=1 Tax=Undibacterium sp. TJN25 TaxID=3413056 RepID=UPI003BF1A45C